MMHDVDFFRAQIEEELRNIAFNQQPPELYDPIRYMLALGGKRLRPALLLMGTEFFGGDFRKAIGPALAIEVFHNFTLLHDDIMDKAPLRRSQQTVHKKWNTDIAILAGDAMFVKSYQLLMDAEEKHLKEVSKIFSKTAIEICEGQQLDMNFESRNDVTIEEYIRMITLKTASLVAGALKIGAVLGGAEKVDAQLLYSFGKNTGIAFQLHDDVLDVYGDHEKFGKQPGGDIISNKKTFLLLKARELAKGTTAKELEDWLMKKKFSDEEKVFAVEEIYNRLGVKEIAESEMNKFYDLAIHELSKINVPDGQKIFLKNFSDQLMVREH